MICFFDVTFSATEYTVCVLERHLTDSLVYPGVVTHAVTLYSDSIRGLASTEGVDVPQLATSHVALVKGLN